MNDDGLHPFLVVTGSSAGGIEALRAFVGGLPPDFPAAVVIAQHTSANHESRLAEILETSSRLPVVTVREPEHLREGHIYVVAQNKNIEIYDGHAMVRAAPLSGSRPSVDRLFVTAAEHFGERLVGIVLSGMGRDGYAGARAIKERGGAVIVQNPDSAGYPAMPLAIPPTLLDIIAEPGQMGGIITTLMREGRSETPIDDEPLLRDLLLELRERSGIDFLQYKMPTIRRRLSRLMIAANTPTLEEYTRYLKDNPDSYQRLVGAFLIKVTEFFRDAALFDALKERILPRLIADAIQGQRELRIWSAGCSTGEEAYSLAILCSELTRQSGKQLDIRIFATDLDQDAVNFARQGRYSREALERVPDDWIERYFVQTGDTYEVKTLRNITVFGHHDLAQRAPFPRIDLILCRNVMIYFVKELQVRALQLFAFSLRNGGVLALGKSENINSLEEFFHPLDTALKLFQRIGNRTLIPPLHIKSMANSSQEKMAAPVSDLGWSIQGEIEQRVTGRLHPNDLIGAFLYKAAIGIAVVDRRYDIVLINDAARTFLEIHGVGIGSDLLHTAQNIDSVRLRELIDSAFRAETPEPLEFAAGLFDGVQRCLLVATHANPSASNTIDGVAVTFIDVSWSVRRRHQLEQSEREQGAALEAFRGQLADLNRRLRGLVFGNEELTVANSQLRLSNEQLVISCEEAASASEEIETLYEEMQATNEELETVNEELQSTVEELNTTNDELEVRTLSLERASAEHEGTIRELEATRRALLEALRASGSCAALIDGNGEPMFLSEQFASAAELEQYGTWWLRDGTLSIAGRTISYTVRRAGPDDELTVVLFK